MAVYATPAELPDGVDDPETLLELASRLVDDATLTARYAVDAEGLPESASIRQLFRAATIAQVRFWHANGLDPAQGVVGATSERRAASKSIGSASVSYDSAAAQQSTAARVEALTTLAPAARATLGHLLSGPVIIYG